MHRNPAGRLPCDGHAVWITAESRDVIMHPLERSHLIEHSVVTRNMVRRLGRQC